MPEVFAEEIEALLERLSGVVSSRVIASETGQIERIHLTAEAHGDPKEIRRAVTSALLSQFNLLLDGARIHVAPLRETDSLRVRSAPRLHSLQERIGESGTQVVVEIRWETDAETRVTRGTAQGTPGPAARLRTVALAALDAMRPMLDPGVRRPLLEAVAILPFAQRQVAVVAVSFPASGGDEQQVGATFVDAGEGEAVVMATLDAAAKRDVPGAVRPRAPWPAQDRRGRLEAMRRSYLTAAGRLPAPAAGDPAPPPPSAPPSPAPSLRPFPRASSSGPAASPEPVAPAARPGPPSSGAVSTSAATARARTSGPSRESQPFDVQRSAAAAASDVLKDISEIRPEPRGGAPVNTREMHERPTGVAGHVERRQGTDRRQVMEDQFYQGLVDGGAPVRILCVDGYEIPQAVIRAFGTYSLLVEAEGREELIFKHGIISIRPLSPVPAHADRRTGGGERFA
ncbi:MAG: RNA chaperone Hfq [Armatimonadetes bacterium]|nr:RNA chaperone Hfq [Armatimonadota bacterium]